MIIFLTVIDIILVIVLCISIIIAVIIAVIPKAPNFVASHYAEFPKFSIQPLILCILSAFCLFLCFMIDLLEVYFISNKFLSIHDYQ